MKTFLIKIILLLSPSLLMAQFSVTSDLSFDYGKDANILGVENIVIFEKIDSSAELNYLLEDTVLTNVEWHYHSPSNDSLIISMAVDDTTNLTLDSLQQGLYELKIDADSYYYSVIDFSEYQSMVDSVWVDDAGDSCNTVRLYASLIRQDIPVYDKLNDTTHLLSEAETNYLWTNETEEDVVPVSVAAPYEDIEYACVPYSDDFFPGNNLAVLYVEPDTVYAETYNAVAVRMSDFDASIPEEEGYSNKLTSSTTVQGSAPLDVTYSVTPEGVGSYTSWYIWNLDEGEAGAPTYSNIDKITYTFSKYSTNGYRVKVVVNNGYCQAVDSVEVKVTESNLEVPNILVLGFGALGKFKVAYQSIDPSTFKAFIYDRNGRLVYSWNDPEGGWDGRTPVTGAYVSPGAYYYSIRAEGTDGETYKLVGDVSVIREKGVR